MMVGIIQKKNKVWENSALACQLSADFFRGATFQKLELEEFSIGFSPCEIHHLKIPWPPRKPSSWSTWSPKVAKGCIKHVSIKMFNHIIYYIYIYKYKFVYYRDVWIDA